MAVDPETMTRDALISLVYDLQSQVEALHGAKAENQTMAIQKAFNMTVQEARMLSALLDGRPHSKDSIFNTVWFDRMYDPPEKKIVDVVICKIRKKLFPYQIRIETIWGAGYLLKDCDRVSSVLNGEPLPELIAFDAGTSVRRPHGEVDKSVISVLISEASPDGWTRIRARELAHNAGLKGSLLPVMQRLSKKGKIQIKSQPTRKSPHSKWIVHVNARAL